MTNSSQFYLIADTGISVQQGIDVRLADFLFTKSLRNRVKSTGYANILNDTTVFARRGAKPVLLERIELVSQVTAREGVLPSGSRGTVVYVYNNADACEVEFLTPFHTVTTVENSDMRIVQ